MKLLTPLGLLGLIAIIVLIIIYIIRPNFQQKMVSTTFMWKLSLKYRKKKIPVSKLRNILLILCQIFALVACAAILSKPVTVREVATDDSEVIAVIDSSASMRAEYDGETRFQRAVAKTLEKAEEVYASGGVMSVIIADESPYFLVTRDEANEEVILMEKLEGILADEEFCSYGSSDVKTAMTLCEELLNENAKAQVYLYTDTQYENTPKQVKVEYVYNTEEWNLAILDASTQMDNNYYSLTVDVASYGVDMDVMVKVNVHDRNYNPNFADPENENSQTLTLNTSEQFVISCKNEEPTRIIFINDNLYQPGNEEEGDTTVYYYKLAASEYFYAYSDINISVTPYDSAFNAQDSMPKDDSFSIFGGLRETIKIQYVSALPNPFFSNVLLALKNNVAEWDFQITEVKQGDTSYATSGFDVYIFEDDITKDSIMPSTLPTDGIVLLVDPRDVPSGADISLNGYGAFNGDGELLTEEAPYHPLMEYVTGEELFVSLYTKIECDPTYDVLLSCDGNPVLIAKNEPDSKVMVMAFSVHYSNLVLKIDFPILMRNLIRYYLPVTVQGNAFEVGENIAVQSRGDTLTVSTNTNEVVETLTEFPNTLVIDKPGTYILKQSEFMGKDIPSEMIYVKAPQSESNIWSSELTLQNPYNEDVVLTHYDDWLFYIAIALFVFVFAEWLLQCRDNM